MAAEIPRRRDHDRHHEREPAIAGRDPGEAREAAREAGHHGHHAVDRLVEQAALIRLAVVQHDAVGVLVDPDEGHAQVGLAAVALGIERNQRAADAPGEQRAAERIGERAPDHVPRDRDRAVAKIENDLVGEDPEHARKARQQQRGLHKADREDGRELGQVLGVLLDALVGIDADLAGKAQHVDAFADQPLVEKVVGQPFAQPDVDHRLQPGLADHQHQQTAGDHGEDHELGHERRHVPLPDRLIEGALPAVEPDLRGRVGADDGDHADRKQLEAAPAGRAADGAQQGRELGDDAIAPQGRSGSGRRLRWRRFFSSVHVLHPELIGLLATRRTARRRAPAAIEIGHAGRRLEAPCYRASAPTGVVRAAG